MRTFMIRYRIRRFDQGGQYEDTKEETVIRSDGNIVCRRYDHHGENGHYRLVSRGTGNADPDHIRKLYEELLALAGCFEKHLPESRDIDAEVILTEDGLKISADAFLSDGKTDFSRLVNAFLDQVKLRTEPHGAYENE